MEDLFIFLNDISGLPKLDWWSHLRSHFLSNYDMQSINRFLYGPTPEERVRAWQAKLRSESRQLDREMRQVGPQPFMRPLCLRLLTLSVGCGYSQSSTDSETAGQQGGCEIGANSSTRGRKEQPPEGQAVC